MLEPNTDDTHLSLSRKSDMALGGLLCVAALVAALQIPEWSLRPTGRPSAWFFPSWVALCLGLASVALLLRGFVEGSRVERQWRAASLASVAMTISVIIALIWVLLSDLALLHGPAEFAALNVLTLTAVVGLTRLSRLSAWGMVLFGLLLSVIGTHVSDGTERFSFGIGDLFDGLNWHVAVLGLIIVADVALCIVSPSALLERYTRRVQGMTLPRLPRVAVLALRLVAFLVAAATSVNVYRLNNSPVELGLLIAFAMLGLASHWFRWSRFPLIVGLLLGALLEEQILRSLAIASGDVTVFVREPISAAYLSAAAVIAAIILRTMTHACPQTPTG